LWRTVGDSIELTVATSADAGWNACPPMGGGAFILRAALVRLIWMATQPHAGFATMPSGWFHRRLDTITSIQCSDEIEPLGVILAALQSRQPTPFCEWIQSRVGPDLHPFEKSVVEADLESVTDLFSAPGCKPGKLVPIQSQA